MAAGAKAASRDVEPSSPKGEHRGRPRRGTLPSGSVEIAAALLADESPGVAPTR
jgi:hypothetical protein